jgi:murein DD-endopeptidase MepM/ murein hydrolase activator NlpD
VTRPSALLAALLLTCCALQSCATPAARKKAEQSLPPGINVVVQPGDDLEGIARAYGVTPDEIAAVNGLPADATLQPGQTLFVPLLSGVPAPSRAGRPDRSERTDRSERGSRSAPREDTHAHEGEAGRLPSMSDDVEGPKHTLPTPPPLPRALSWPVDGVVLRDFNKKGSPPYEGLLIAAPLGTVVTAAADGDVLFAGDQGTAYGVMVILAHGADLVTVYAHLSRVDVEKGAHVARGEALGAVGQTGRQDAPRLHFQVRRGRTPVDPLPLLPP